MEGGGDDDHAAAAAVVIEHKAYARVGLLGNPSDVYYGNTIAFSISNFFATVKLIPSIELIIQPHPTHDLVNFSSNHQLVSLFHFHLHVHLLFSLSSSLYITKWHWDHSLCLCVTD